MLLAVSLEPQRQPLGIRRLGSRTRSALCSSLPGPGSKATSHFGYVAKCARLVRPVSRAPQCQTHSTRGPGGCPNATPSSIGIRRSVRGSGHVPGGDWIEAQTDERTGTLAERSG
jgi:hypothetical protein